VWLSVCDSSSNYFIIWCKEISRHRHSLAFRVSSGFGDGGSRQQIEFSGDFIDSFTSRFRGITRLGRQQQQQFETASDIKETAKMSNIPCIAIAWCCVGLLMQQIAVNEGQ